MRIAGLVQDSIVDGPGFRFVVFAQGCKKRCERCHNPDTWDIDGGEEMGIDEIIHEMLSNPLTDGLTISGGEPFLQAMDCAKLAKAAKEKGLNVWVYSGYTYEELTGSDDIVDALGLLELTDVLVDGAYIHDERTSELRWRGSRNQRVIDVPRSMESGKTVLIDL